MFDRELAMSHKTLKKQKVLKSTGPHHVDMISNVLWLPQVCAQFHKYPGYVHLLSDNVYNSMLTLIQSSRPDY